MYKLLFYFTYLKRSFCLISQFLIIESLSKFPENLVIAIIEFEGIVRIVCALLEMTSDDLSNDLLF